MGSGSWLRQEGSCPRYLVCWDSVSCLVGRGDIGPAYKEVLSSGRNAESEINIVALTRCKAPANISNPKTLKLQKKIAKLESDILFDREAAELKWREKLLDLMRESAFLREKEKTLSANEEHPKVDEQRPVELGRHVRQSGEALTAAPHLPWRCNRAAVHVVHAKHAVVFALTASGGGE